MRSPMRVIVKVRFERSPETGLVQDDYMIQTFAAYRPDQSFHVGVLPFCQGDRGAQSTSSTPSAAADSPNTLP
jgi:hypothetical protein